MKETILVTGGAGYIGSHIVKQLGERGHNVVILDNLSTGHKEAITYGTLEVGDLSDHAFVDGVMKKHKPVAVMHFAGSIVVPESVENPIKYYQNNTENSLHLVRLCLENNINKFIFSSTAAVYGNLQEKEAKEETQTNPESPYGKSKLMTEWMLEDTSFAHPDFRYIALRYFNVSGADLEGRIGQSFPKATHLIKVNCEAAAGKREKTFIFGTDFETPDGTGIRDYIHVVDLASAHLEALDILLKGGESKVYNCGYGKGLSVREVVRAVKEITGKDFVVEEGPRRAGDPAVIVSNVDKILKETNWRPKYNDLTTIITTAYNWELNKRY